MVQVFFSINKKREKGKYKRRLSSSRDLKIFLKCSHLHQLYLSPSTINMYRVQFVRQHVPIKEIVQLGRQHVQIKEMVQFVDPHVQIKEIQDYDIGLDYWFELFL